MKRIFNLHRLFTKMQTVTLLRLLQIIFDKNCCGYLTLLLVASGKVEYPLGRLIAMHWNVFKGLATLPAGGANITMRAQLLD